MFAYIITNWYISNKFFVIRIDTNASIYFMLRYGQFFAYQKHKPNTSIDNSIKEAINIQFSICFILFIGFVIINTPIDNIEFHVIQINTLFFFIWPT